MLIFFKLKPSFKELYWNFTGMLQGYFSEDGSNTRIAFLVHSKNEL
jgi:hypothetical protein